MTQKKELRFQPDIAADLLQEAPKLVNVFLDGLIWRSHKTKDSPGGPGVRRVPRCEKPSGRSGAGEPHAVHAEWGPVLLEDRLPWWRT